MRGVKYTYAYKTSDGVRHEDSMESESREAVFAALRERGIRAIKVTAADGSKANGEVRGVRTRLVVAFAVLSALVAAVGTLLLLRTFPSARTDAAFEEMTRRQPIGDAAVIEKGCRTGWSDVFPEEGERFFASFAVPGVKAGLRNTTVEALNAALRRTVKASAHDTLEARQIKAMVEGMKREARAYVAAGGNIVEYGKRLTERQDAEIAIYERCKKEIEDARKTLSDDALAVLWEERNDQLRNLGIKLISLEE